MFKKYAVQTKLVKTTGEENYLNYEDLRQLTWYYTDALWHTTFAVGTIVVLKTVCKIAESRLS